MIEEYVEVNNVAIAALGALSKNMNLMKKEINLVLNNLR